MKKLFVLFLLSVFAVFSFATTAFADDELIDLYPYNNIGCMTTTEPCTNTRVGTSNWKLEYEGFRYHFVSNSVRYAKDFIDANDDGIIGPTERPSISFNAFSSLIINDSVEDMVLSTADGRADITGGVVHRIYAYFDENGDLQMIEDQIFSYLLTNDGTVEAPDWRFATAAEKTTYDAAPEESKPANMISASIRMKLDETDSNGYIIEPIIWIQWVKLGVDTAVDPVEDWSDIIDGNPNFVYLPAGWSLFTIGTFDRDSQYPSTDLAKALPTAMIDSTTAPMNFYYVEQPSTFAGLTALDVDPVTPGVNMVVEYEKPYVIPSTISVSWRNMYDDNDIIINLVEKIDYQVRIEQDGVVLQTINMIYDPIGDTYTPDGPVTVIDTDTFGEKYDVFFIAETPEGIITTVQTDLSVGVIPPRFENVTPRYEDEGVVFDPIGLIFANDGYGNDLTDTVKVTYPVGFNPYNPKPGTYQINLSFDHTVTFAAVPFAVDVRSGTYVRNIPASGVNSPIAINVAIGSDPLDWRLWTSTENFKTVASGWGSVIVHVAADGTMKDRWDRFTGQRTTADGIVAFTAAELAAWQNTVVLAKGEYIVAAHGSTLAASIRQANVDAVYGSSLVVTGKLEFNYKFVTNTSYTLNVDDITAPTLLVVKPKVIVTAGEFSSVNEVVLGNVVAIDNYDTVAQLAIFVSSNGGLNLNTPGTYNVSVTAEDRAGNASVVSFQVEVKAPAITNDSIIDLIEGNTLSEEDIQALIDAGLITPEQIQALIDASIDQLPADEVGTSLVVTIIVALSSGLLSFGGAFLLMKKKLF